MEKGGALHRADPNALLEELTRLKGENERLRTELRRVEARSTALEEAGNLGVWDLDPATGEGTWSPQLFQLYDLPVASQPPPLEARTGLVHPDDLATISRNIEQLLATGYAPPVVFRTNPYRGPVRVLRVAVTRTEEHDGKVRVYGAVAEITQQARVEGQLAASAGKLEALFVHAPYTIFELDRELRMIFINRFAEGYSADEVLGRPIDGHICERDRPRLRAFVERVFEEGLDGTIEIEDIFGSRWESHYVRLQFGDEPPTALCFARDVTERRQLDMQMAQAQKLESIGVLAGGIAHDFNNLLVSILGNAELALLELPRGSPAAETIGEVIAGSHRASELCRQLLAYAGQGRFVVEVVDLPRLVREMVDLLELSLSKQAKLSYDFDPSTLPVEGDVTQLRQIVMNLITNASDAIGKGSGLLSIATGARHCDHGYLREVYLRDDLPEGRYTFLEVSDTGCGMDESTRSRMFDPFFSSKSDGRGLGLAAVLGIVRGHRGAIRVDSKLGQGTVITVLLPEAPGPVSVHPDDSAPTEEIRPGVGTVLVVDDEPSVRYMAERSLTRLGYSVLSAGDGVEAVEMYRWRRQQVAAVILDMTMPRMDGKAALAELRKINAHVRVLLSSGNDGQVEASPLLAPGRTSFLQKPYRPGDLAEALQDLLSEP